MGSIVTSEGSMQQMYSVVSRMVEDYKQSPTDWPETKRPYLEALENIVEANIERRTEEFERIYALTGVTTQAELAHILGKRPQTVSHAQKTGQVPASWFIELATKYNVDINWLRTGRKNNLNR